MFQVVSGKYPLLEISDNPANSISFLVNTVSSQLLDLLGQLFLNINFFDRLFKGLFSFDDDSALLDAAVDDLKVWFDLCLFEWVLSGKIQLHGLLLLNVVLGTILLFDNAVKELKDILSCLEFVVERLHQVSPFWVW